jgi:biopolymer transport protein ExbD
VSRRSKNRASNDANEIDLTPMLDVVFIMLIFFIVTASFVKEVGINPNTPESNSDNQAKPDEQNILVKISADNQIWLMEKDGERRIDTRAIRSNLERMRAELPKAAVIIQAAPESDAGTYVTVADAARQAKAPNVVLVPMKQ